MTNNLSSSDIVLASLVGGKAFLEYDARRRAFHDLAFAYSGNNSVVSIKDQNRAQNILSKYGHRTARRLARSILR